MEKAFFLHPKDTLGALMEMKKLTTNLTFFAFYEKEKLVIEATDYQEILFEVKDDVAWITINRPEVMNAFREQTWMN